MQHKRYAVHHISWNSIRIASFLKSSSTGPSAIVVKRNLDVTVWIPASALPALQGVALRCPVFTSIAIAMTSAEEYNKSYNTITDLILDLNQHLNFQNSKRNTLSECVEFPVSDRSRRALRAIFDLHTRMILCVCDHVAPSRAILVSINVC